MKATKDAKIGALRQVPLFADGLTKTDFAALARAIDEVELPAGTYLFRQGDPAVEFYLIRSGTVDVVSKRKHLMTCRPGDYLGDVSLIVPAPRRASAVAVTDVSAFVMTRGSFLLLLQDHPNIELKVLRFLARRVLESSEHPAR